MAELGRRALQSWPRWLPLVSLYAIALSLRLPFTSAPMYGDEAILYYLSRYPLQDVPNLHILGEDRPYPLAFYFWWRPLFRVYLIPPALLGFDTYRAAYILSAALLPPAVAWSLRRAGVRAWLAYGVGLITAVGPVFVHWGFVAFPDTPMAIAFVLGLGFQAQRREAAAAGAFAAAIALKELAAVGVLALAMVALYEGLRNGSMSIWPLRLTRRLTGLAAAVAVGMAPLLVYLAEGGRPPGWTLGGNGPELLDHLFPVLWLAPFVLAGLLLPRARMVAAAAVAYAAFYAAYAFVLERGVEAWYLVLPHALALMAVAIVLDAWFRRAAATASPRAAAGPRAAAVFLVLLVASQILLPSTVAAKQSIGAPFSGQAPGSLWQTWDAEKDRDRHLEELLGAMGPPDWGTVFLVDLGWYFKPYPFADKAGTAYFAYTDWPPHDGWSEGIERTSNATIVSKYPPVRPFNEAIRSTYADCIAFENAGYALIRGHACSGRARQLHEAAGE
jgi:hypothetical protein